MKRKGDWIQTYTGQLFYPLSPRPEEVRLMDIVHALSNICRFTGHTSRFYSVAQHSVLVSEVLMKLKYPHKENLFLYGLLHDASEAYLSDIARPVKKMSAFDEYRRIETMVQSVIYQAFGLPKLDEEGQAALDIADETILLTEGRDLMPNVKQWGNYGKYEPLTYTISPWSPKVAENRFLQLFYSKGVPQ